MSAQELAAQVQPGSAVRWDRLERAAFSGYPPIIDDRLGARATGQSGVRNFFALILGIPLAIVYLACYLAPVWGYAVVYDGIIASAAAAPDPKVAFPLSAVFFIVASCLLVLSTAHWIIAGRRRNGFYQVQAGLAVGLGFLAAQTIQYEGATGGFDNWPLWLIPSLSAATLGVLFLFLHVLSSRARNRRVRTGLAREHDLPSKRFRMVRQRRKRISALSPEQRAAVRSDIDSAINDLERRRLIVSAEADRARGVELGALDVLAFSAKQRSKRGVD